jgi:hypothetical protein
MNKLTITTAALAVTIILSASGCRTLTPEEAAYQREYNLRVFQMFQQGQMNLNTSGAIRHLGCNVRDYCYY